LIKINNEDKLTRLVAQPFNQDNQWVMTHEFSSQQIQTLTSMPTATRLGMCLYANRKGNDQRIVRLGRLLEENGGLNELLFKSHHGSYIQVDCISSREDIHCWLQPFNFK